jgi:hypothetical protein
MGRPTEASPASLSRHLFLLVPPGSFSYCSLILLEIFEQNRNKDEDSTSGNKMQAYTGLL